MKLNLGQCIILGYACFLLAACAGANIPDAQPTTGRNPTVAEVPSADETVRGDEDPPIVTLELGSMLHAKRLSDADQLPGNIIIPTTNLNAVPITAALQAVLSGTDVSLSWNTGSLGDNLVTVMNLSGPLPKVVDRICSAAKVFCSYRNGSLELSDKETFVVALPPVAKGAGSSGGSGSSGGNNSMVDTISQLSGGKVQIDDQGGNVIYTTNVLGQERVVQYLEQLRNGRPLVVMQMYIWEVTLNKQNAEGINWSEFKLGHIPLPYLGSLAAASTSSLASVTGDNVSLGAITTGRVNSNSVAQFLSTQGRVQTISNPQITFVSGSNAKFVAGGEQSYISSVGQLVSATNVSGTNNASSTSGVGTNTVNLDKIKTGLTVDVNGAFENGVVFANLDLNLINLVSLDTAAGTIVQTPITSNREVNTIIRVRPGDNLVMAGMVTSQDTNSREGIPLPGDDRLPTYGSDQYQNVELVIMIKPSVIMFSDKTDNEVTRKKELSKPLPDAVIIDKDGAKTVAVPGQTPTAATDTAVTDPNRGKVSISNLLADQAALAAANGAPPAATDTSLPSETISSTTTSTTTTLGASADAATSSIMTPGLPPHTQLAPTVSSNADNGPMPLNSTPSASDTDGAVVDRRLMQRGFSHAFDDMLQPSSLQLSSGEGRP